MSERRRTILEQRWEAALAAEQERGARREQSGQDDHDEVREAADASEPDPQQELAALQGEVEALKDQVLRTQAELVNFRRRTARDREDHAARTRADVLRELLPIVDDFDRAVSADPDNPEAYREGVEMILRALHELLARFGVERIDPLGERFDPRLHEAVEQVTEPEGEAGRVVAVYQTGYRLGERLLRPARVVVSAAGTAGRVQSDESAAGVEVESRPDDEPDSDVHRSSD